MFLLESDLQTFAWNGSNDVSCLFKMNRQNVKGWKYYNHAMIPTTAPHEAVDLSAVKSGEIWNYKSKEGKPLFVRWASEWDCGYYTGWWFVIREAPFDLAELSSSSRRNIRKSLRNCRIEKIDPSYYLEDLWRVFNEAIERYENYDILLTKNAFFTKCNTQKNEQEYWAGFDCLSGRMIGYAVFCVHDDWVEFQNAKYSTQYLKLRVSDAINATVLDYYLNILKKIYISDGERSILHKTNVQNYLKEHFGYRYAFCKLHLMYRKPLKIIIKSLYPIRKILKKIDNIKLFHYINSFMLMEEIINKDFQ